ncbi:MAG: hypothetical protein AB7S68_33530 [Polyangiaceae bacterium]
MVQGTQRVALALGLLGLGLVTGCGGAAPAPAEPPTNDLQELERRLEEHQSELEARFGSLSQKDKGTAAPEAPEAPMGDASGEGTEPAVEPAPPPAVPAAESVEMDEESESGGDRRELSACDVGCQALDGMRRAAARICEVAGTTSDPCTRARSRVGRAEERVTGAGCSCE